MKIGITYTLLWVLLLFVISNNCTAQSYANEWINYAQQYFRIHSSQDGLYSIPYSTLLSAGVPVGSIDPRNVQIFHNEKKQYIYIYKKNSNGI